MKTNIELSIVILCYRAEEAMIPFAAKVKKIAEEISDDYQLVLVGNYIEGQPDRTKEIIEEIARNDSHYKVVAKPKKGMMGWDMNEGLKNCDGEYLCVIDGDGQFPAESIASCFKEIKTGKYDLVKTYRSKRNDGLYRYLISRIYNGFFAILFPGLRSKDINSKPKIITRKAFEQMDLKSTDWFIDAELMLNVRKLKMRIHEVPIVFIENMERKSFVKFGATIEFVLNMIRYWFNEKLGKK